MRIPLASLGPASECRGEGRLVASQRELARRWRPAALAALQSLLQTARLTAARRQRRFEPMTSCCSAGSSRRAAPHHLERTLTRLPSRWQTPREICLEERSRRSPRGAATRVLATALQRVRFALTIWGRSSRGVSHLVALSLHFDCPVARPPSALALSPKRAPSTTRSASACASLGEVRRGAARDRSPGGFALVVGGVGRLPVRSMTRGG